MRETIVIVSGGFDPPHGGHFNLWEEAANLGDHLAIIINRDKFLKEKRKKKFGMGFVVMPREDRMRIAKCWGDFVIESLDHDNTVCATLIQLKLLFSDYNLIFANGGDRNKDKEIPEATICRELGIEMAYGIGGNFKQNASTDIIKNLFEVFKGIKRY